MEVGPRVLDLLARGEHDAAATAVIEGLGPAVLGYLHALHRDPDDAKDVFQQWAEDLWRNVAQLRTDVTLRGWAFRLAWHASLRFRRQVWQRRRVRLATTAASRLAASVVQSVPLGRFDERLEILGKDLDKQDRALLLLRLHFELSWDEIAEVLAGEGSEATPASLRKRFQRLKQRLGTLAREKGLVE